jgi:hypothetical protein
MRRGLVAAYLLPLVLIAVTGCTQRRNGDAATASTTPALTAQDRALKYTQCMRDHGVRMDDPQVQGNQIQLGEVENTDQAVTQAAEQACQQHKPGGGANGNPPAEKIELLRQLARCMRDNGVERFPDPDASGKLPIDGSVTKDPQYEQAQSACRQDRSSS